MTPWQELTRSYTVWSDTEIKGFFGYGKDEYGFLSNFFPAPTMFEGVIYPTSEHAYMASKTTNESERAIILSAAKPRDAKNLGRTVTLRPNWDVVRYDFMLAVVFDKFWRNPHLQERLLATGNRYLEETNHWKDLYYGVDFKTGKGENVLGKILMKVRSCLQK